MSAWLPSPPLNDRELRAIWSVFLPFPGAASPVLRVLPFAERMDVVAELSGALSLATRSGQAHLMSKVLTILRREMRDVTSRLASSDLPLALSAMTQLEQEAGRICPGPNAFNRHARVVVDALVRASDSPAA